MQFFADCIRIFSRDGQEEACYIGQHGQTTFFSFLSKDICTSFNHLIVIVAFFANSSQKFRIIIDGSQGAHCRTVDVGPSCTAGVLVDISKFFDNFFTGRYTNHSTGTLTVESKAFGHAVANDGQDICRQTAQFFEDFTHFFFFTCVVNVCYVKEQDDVFATFSSFFQNIEYAIHIFFAQAVTSGVMSRSVQDVKQVVLFSKEFFYFFFQCRQIEFVVFVQHFVGSKVTVHVSAQYFIRTPEPVGAKYGVAFTLVVPNCMMDCTGTTSSSNSSNMCVRTGFTESSGHYAFQVFRQTGDGSVRNQFVSCQTAINFFYGRQAHQLFIFV